MSKYSYEEKLEAVLRIVEDGMGCGTSARIMGVRHSLVEGWAARYRQFGPEGITLFPLPSELKNLTGPACFSCSVARLYSCPFAYIP